MPVDFVGREIEVTLSEDEASVPLTFRLGQRQYKIVEQLAHWEDHAFASLRRGRDWREQQQRRNYRVRTEEGEVFEIYADWSPARRRRKGAPAARWYLHRRLGTMAAAEEPAAVDAAEA